MLDRVRELYHVIDSAPAHAEGLSLESIRFYRLCSGRPLMSAGEYGGKSEEKLG